MLEFFGVLAVLSFGFSIEAVSFVTADFLQDLVTPFLVSSVFPILYHKQIAASTQSERLFSAFMDHLPGYAWIKDTDGRYVYVNKRLQALSDFEHDFLGKTDADLWPPEIATVYRGNDLKVITTGKTVETIESLVVNGEQRCLLVTKFPIFDESGAIIMVGGTSVDITEHRRMEEALRESESFRRMIIESEPECVKVVAPDYTLLDMNPAGLEMIEATSREQVVGQSVLNLIAPECRSSFIGMHKRVCQGESAVTEYKMVGLKGSQRWMESHAAPILDKESRVIAQLAITRDVTERRRAENELMQSERQLAEAQRIAHIGSWSWDLKSETQIWSDELYRIYGLEPGTVKPTYEAFLELVHPEDRIRIKETVERSLKTREPINLYLRITRPDGEQRIIQSKGCILYNEQGNPIRKLGTSQDVTEHWRAQEALREAEEKYHSIFENAVEGIFQSTPDGKFMSANPALARMLGFDSPEELISTRTNIAQEHYVDPKSREDFKRSLEENGSIFDFELEAYRKDGSKIWVSENVRAVRDNSGAVVYYEGTTQDITGRKQAEEALRESEERYRDLVENSRDLICTHDLDGWIRSANRAALEGMGYSSEDYAGGKNLRELLAPEVRDQFDDYLNKIRTDGVASGLMLVQTKAGEKRIWEYHNTLRTQGVSAPIVRGMAQDITERRRANHSLRLFRALIDQCTDAIEVVDPKTLQFLDCNQSAYNDLGYTREQFLSLTVYDIDPLVDDQMLARLDQEMDRSGFVIFESLHRRKDGSTFPVEINLKIVRLERDYRLAVVRDITERRMAEEALRQAEQKYRDIFENAGEGIFQSTPDGRFIAANPAMARIHGFATPEEFIQRRQDISRQIYVDPARREEFKRQIEEQGAVRGLEQQVLRKDGSKIWVTVNAHVVRNQQGEVLYYEGTAQDITERKRIEEALTESERRKDAILKSALDCIVTVDHEGSIIGFNPAAERTFGYAKESVVGKKIVDLIIPPSLRSDHELGFHTYPASGCSTWLGKRIEISAMRSDGSEFPIELTITAIGELERPVFTAFIRDLTDRKRAEVELQKSEERYRELFENAKDAIYVHDLSGTYTSINRAAEKLSGYSREEILGRNFNCFVAPEYADYMRENLCKKLRQEGETTYEVEVITKDGRRVPVEVSSHMIYEEGAPVAVQGTARNIVERKRAEEALRGYSQQLIRAQEAERQSIARELHDQIGQVLTAIRINLETTRDCSSRAESNALIEEGVTIVDEAIQQVRDLSFELRPSLLDDLGLSAALRWYSDRYTQRTGIQTKTSLCPESRNRLPRELETACFRIVQEALTNVARHAQAKNVSIDVKTMNGALSLSIKDDGVGFDFQARTNGELLNSLGLRGMEERAHGVGGKLEITSAPHEGTEVRVLFPQGSKSKGLT